MERNLHSILGASDLKKNLCPLVPYQWAVWQQAGAGQVDREYLPGTPTQPALPTWVTGLRGQGKQAPFCARCVWDQ